MFKKYVLFFAAMKQLAYALAQSGHQLIHLTPDKALQCQTLTALLDVMLKPHGIETFEYRNRMKHA